MKTLGLKTVIIKYSYNPDKDVIYMYLLRLSSDDNGNFQFFVKNCNVNIWFQDCGLPKNTCLEEMVSKALEDTVVTEDKKSGAIGNLSMLHSLLVQYIEEDLERCDTFVFAPGHGCLATVPFAALYDDRKHEFLIARKCVAVIPSILSLHHCMYLQK